MKKVFTTLMALAVGISAMAQGGISDEALKKIKEGYKGTPEEVALRNAISRNDINKLAVNLESQANIHISHTRSLQRGSPTRSQVADAGCLQV